MALERQQRARREQDKQLRRQDILRAATTLLATRRYPEIKMIDIAREANLAKGTVFLYFPTKESLFLVLLTEMLRDWLSVINDALDNARGRWTTNRVARIFAETLTPRDSLTRLLTLVSSVLEYNVDEDRVADFKHTLIGLLAPTGARVERRLSFLSSGEGTRILMNIYAIIVGVRQLCDPGPTANAVLQKPELAVLQMDFGTELRTTLSAFLRGREVMSAKSLAS